MAGKTGRPTSGLRKGDVSRKVSSTLRDMGLKAIAERDMAGLGADAGKKPMSAFDKERPKRKGHPR
jgi:hypothetical protein